MCDRPLLCFYYGQGFPTQQPLRGKPLASEYLCISVGLVHTKPRRNVKCFLPRLKVLECVSVSLCGVYVCMSMWMYLSVGVMYRFSYLISPTRWALILCQCIPDTLGFILLWETIFLGGSQCYKQHHKPWLGFQAGPTICSNYKVQCQALHFNSGASTYWLWL